MFPRMNMKTHIHRQAECLLNRGKILSSHTPFKFVREFCGKNSPKLVDKENYRSDKPYHARNMSWAQRLKRIFNIKITECEKCEKQNVTIIACIIDTLAIQKILAHLDKKYQNYCHLYERRPASSKPMASPFNATSIMGHRLPTRYDTEKHIISWWEGLRVTPKVSVSIVWQFK